jgi:hypothetical protein
MKRKAAALENPKLNKVSKKDTEEKQQVVIHWYTPLPPQVKLEDQESSRPWHFIFIYLNLVIDYFWSHSVCPESTHAY